MKNLIRLLSLLIVGGGLTFTSTLAQEIVVYEETTHHENNGDICATQAISMICSAGSPNCPVECRGEGFAVNFTDFIMENMKDPKTIEEWFQEYSLDDLFFGRIPAGDLTMLLNTTLTESEARTMIGKLTDYLYAENGEKFMFQQSGKQKTSNLLKTSRNNFATDKAPGKPKRTLSYKGDCNGALGITNVKILRNLDDGKYLVSYAKTIDYCLGGEHRKTFRYILGTVIHEHGHVRDANENKDYGLDSSADSPFRNICRNTKSDRKSECGKDAFASSYAMTSRAEDYAETFTYVFLKDKHFNASPRGENGPTNAKAKQKIAYFPAWFANNQETQPTDTQPTDTSSSTKYPGCDKEDINIAGYTIAACNIGAQKAGVGQESYGNYFSQKQLPSCAKGYHIPSKEERQGLRNNFLPYSEEERNKADLFREYLLLPLAGYKDAQSATVEDAGREGVFLTSSSSRIFNLSFPSRNEGMGIIDMRDGGQSADGISARCFKDTPNPADKSKYPADGLICEPSRSGKVMTKAAFDEARSEKDEGGRSSQQILCQCAKLKVVDEDKIPSFEKACEPAGWEFGTNVRYVAGQGNFRTCGTQTCFVKEPNGTAPTDSNKPVDDTGNKPVDDTGNKPVDDTGTKPVDDTGNKPVDDTGTKPVDDTGTKPVDDTGTKPVDDTGTKPVDDTGTKPTTTPTNPSTPNIQSSVTCTEIDTTNNQNSISFIVNNQPCKAVTACGRFPLEIGNMIGANKVNKIRVQYFFHPFNHDSVLRAKRSNGVIRNLVPYLGTQAQTITARIEGDENSKITLNVSCK